MKISGDIDLGNMLVGIAAVASWIGTIKIHRNVKTKNGRTIGQVVDNLGDTDDLAVTKRKEEDK